MPASMSKNASLISFSSNSQLITLHTYDNQQEICNAVVLVSAILLGWWQDLCTNIHIMTGLKKLVILTCVVIKLAYNLQFEWSELNCAINITIYKKCHIFSQNSAWNGPTIKTICTTLVTNHSHRKKKFCAPSHYKHWCPCWCFAYKSSVTSQHHLNRPLQLCWVACLNAPATT